MYEPFDAWDSLLTKDYLDSRFAIFEEQIIRDLRRATLRLVVWTIVAAIAGMAVSTALVGTLA